MMSTCLCKGGGSTCQERFVEWTGARAFEKVHVEARKDRQGKKVSPLDCSRIAF